MQRILLFSLGLFLLALNFSCADDLAQQQNETPAAPERDVLTKAEINAIVEDHLFSTNTVFNWNEADPFLVYSAMTHNQQEAALGYQPAGFADVDTRIHEIEVTKGAWLATRNALIERIISETARLTGETLTEEDLLAAPEDGVLPILEVKINHPELVKILRELPEVRYLEPSGYEPAEVSLRSDSGCSNDPDYGISSADYTNVSPGSKIPWNFYNANIPQAWNVSRGDNVGVCIIDTGISGSQSRLNGTFSSGNSTGRYRNKYGTYVSSWWPWASPDGPNDQCGHGTQMAGLATAPRVSGGSSIGVAYQADLISVRGTSDVIVNSSREKNGVKDALVLAGNRSDVNIISMSIGDVFYSGTVNDGINFAYNKGKLIFAAAGTSLSWTSWWGVIFPANRWNTVAVTGVRDGSSLQRCNTCHDGSEVDFVAVMQRASNSDRTSLTLAMSGNQPSYVGGSSAATATTAGIAALVWGTNLGQSRSQVLNRMKNAASIYPARDGNFGWGIVDAYAAVSN
ncbi:protease [Lewinellaceae bacterium SD302]|nr:protease [Lewinellaceae bacterium SD302]